MGGAESVGLDTALRLLSARDSENKTVSSTVTGSLEGK
jgi:hypothetical protein